ncbi:hypothetical protein ABID52_003395 [Fictibacillus halophilus]|uniref:Uncharacterized protein n=1 Tax=Fictibacillus halophilus TaxID=1610490 RepID=A0ABV2LML8_9BACL
MVKEMVVIQIAVTVVINDDSTISYHGLPEEMY